MEAHKKIWNIIRVDLQGSPEHHRQAAELFAESVRLEGRRKLIKEIKQHVGFRSFDVDGNKVYIEVQKLQQYLTSLKTE